MVECTRTLSDDRDRGRTGNHGVDGHWHYQGNAVHAFQGRFPGEGKGEERTAGTETGTETSPHRYTGLRGVPDTGMRPSKWPLAFRACLRLLPEGVQSPVPPCGEWLHSTRYRCRKKRQKEGTLGFPRSRDNENGEKGGSLRTFQHNRNNVADSDLGEKEDRNYLGQGTDIPLVHSHQPSAATPGDRGGHDTTPIGGASPVTGEFMLRMQDIYYTVMNTGMYNYRGARIRVPSGLCIEAWERYLCNYTDHNLVSFLAYGWPINHERTVPLISTPVNHPSATQHPQHIDFYVDTERGFEALLGPFTCAPVDNFHTSPLMTRPKKDSANRRVIVDLSWPEGGAVNDGIPENTYIDGFGTISLPTVDYMENRILQLGPGAFLYKTDLARGYRQLRVDPHDWPLLGFSHNGYFYMDPCPPFGLRTSALFMQRTSEAICFIHGKAGFLSRPYLDDFGGAERTYDRAFEALSTLQDILRNLGVREAVHKVCGPAQRLVWLGLLYDTNNMTISIPKEKLEEIMELLKMWEGKQRATRGQMQSLLGTLQFVAGVSPPTRIFTNRMLQDLREAPKRGTESLSWGFKRDLAFFLALLPHYNGIKIIDKDTIAYQDQLELDACLTGCGACTGEQHYAERFPDRVLKGAHTIAHLELLNVVVAVKVWRIFKYICVIVLHFKHM